MEWGTFHMEWDSFHMEWDYVGTKQNSVGSSMDIKVNGGVSRDFGKGEEHSKEWAKMGEGIEYIEPIVLVMDVQSQ